MCCDDFVTVNLSPRSYQLGPFAQYLFSHRPQSRIAWPRGSRSGSGIVLEIGLTILHR